MTAWRSRGWLLALAAGYLLFYGVLYAETAYSLPRLSLGHGSASAAELFRAPWFASSLRLAPLRWLACGPCQRYDHLGLWLLVTAVLLLAGGYLGALRAVCQWPEAWPLPRLLGFAALAALPLALLLPPTSGDYVAYLFLGRMLSVFHANPWNHTLADFPIEQRYLAPTAWGVNLQCIYGPAWVAVSAFTTGLADRLMPGPMSFGSLLLNVLLMRAANGLALVAAALAVWRINGRLWPRQQRLVTAAFLLNPLLVYEAIGGLHNDLWGVLFLLWSAELFLRDDGRYVIPLTLSFLTKYVSLAITPFLGVYYWRRRDWRRLAWLTATVLIGLGLAQMTSMPRLSHYVSASRHLFLLSATALPQFVAMVITLIRGLPSLQSSLVWASAQVLTALCVPIYLLLLARTRTPEQVVRHGLLALGFYMAGAYVQTVPWYSMWLLGLLCAVRWNEAAVNAIWGATFVLLAYVVQFWNHAGLYGWNVWTIVPGYLLAVGLPALLWLAGHRGWWRACPLPASRDAGPGDRPGSGRSAPHGARRRGASPGAAVAGAAPSMR